MDFVGAKAALFCGSGLLTCQRDETPGDLKAQFPVIEQAVAALGVRNVRLQGHEADDLIGTMDLDAPWPGEAAEGQRGRAGSPRVVALPENWLRSRELDQAQAAQVAQAELSVSGG